MWKWGGENSLTKATKWWPDLIQIFEIIDKCVSQTETPYMTTGWTINMKNVEINDPWSDDITTASVIWWNHPLALTVVTDVSWYASLQNTFGLARGKLNERRHNYPARQGSMSPDYCGNLSVSTVLVFSSLSVALGIVCEVSSVQRGL